MKKEIDFGKKTILITGAAGFIGWALAKRVCAENPRAKVVGFDSINDYYDVMDDIKSYIVKKSGSTGATVNSLKLYLADIDYNGIVDEYDENALLALIIKTGAKKEILPGDANLDGIINSKDVTLVRRFASKLAKPTSSQKAYSDINGDGKINSTDSKIIKRIYETILW